MSMFTVSGALEQLMSWVYYSSLLIMQQFMDIFDGMGSALFNNPFVNPVLTFFQMLGNVLFLVGILFSLGDYFISVQDGKGSLKDVSMNVFRGMLATALFTTVPVQLYQLAVNVQSAVGGIIANVGFAAITPPGNPGIDSNGGLWDGALNSFIAIAKCMPVADNMGSLNDSVNSSFGGADTLHIPSVMWFLFAIALTYCFFKLLFANLKRGGILLIQICVGALYIFPLTHGYSDSFYSWCKQIIGLCFTVFLQNCMFLIGLAAFQGDPAMGIGVMLAATEVPRIAQAFGMETSMRANLSGTVMMTTNLMNFGKSLLRGAH